MGEAARLLIAGGTVVDPANGVEGARDVLIDEGRIAAVDAPGAIAAAHAVRLDAAGCLVVPGLIDMHVHLREPGYEYRETVATGAAAAAAGGFTAVACMANTKPVNDSGAVTEYILDKARAAGRTQVFPIGAVSKGLEGVQLAEIGEMRRAGIVAVSDDGHPIADGGLMRRALEYARLFGLAVIAHEEDPRLVDDGVMHEGALSIRLGLKGVPAAAEEGLVARDIALAGITGGRLHLAHLSTAGSVHLVREAKQRGVAVTAEVTPHHLTLTEDAVGDYDTNAKMNPPLRTARDVAALREGLRDGTIDVIASDHAPHHRDEKEVEFDRALHGVIGLETALPLALRVAAEAGIPLPTVVRAMTAAPARVLGLERGTLSPGAVADVTVIDPRWRWEYRAAEGFSKSRNSPFDGWPFQGRARWTVVCGRVVWALEEAASGRESRVRA